MFKTVRKIQSVTLDIINKTCLTNTKRQLTYLRHVFMDIHLKSLILITRIMETKQTTMSM